MQKLIAMCFGGVASPYENEEILYLSTVAGLIRKEPFLINLFLPSHQHSAFVNARLGSMICRSQKIPTSNPLFDDIDNGMRQIALVPDVSDVPIIDSDAAAAAAAGSSDSGSKGSAENMPNSSEEFECDCDIDEDRLALLDSILGYFDSPVCVNICLIKKTHFYYYSYMFYIQKG